MAAGASWSCWQPSPSLLAERDHMRSRWHGGAVTGVPKYRFRHGHRRDNFRQMTTGAEGDHFFRRTEPDYLAHGRHERTYLSVT